MNDKYDLVIILVFILCMPAIRMCGTIESVLGWQTLTFTKRCCSCRASVYLMIISRFIVVGGDIAGTEAIPNATLASHNRHWSTGSGTGTSTRHFGERSLHTSHAIVRYVRSYAYLSTDKCSQTLLYIQRCSCIRSSSSKSNKHSDIIL